MLALAFAQNTLHAFNHLLDVGEADPGWLGPVNLASLVLASLLLAWMLNAERERGPMRVFVAGASGAIGRPLLPRLLANGHEVTGQHPLRAPRRGDPRRRRHARRRGRPRRGRAAAGGLERAAGGRRPRADRAARALRSALEGPLPGHQPDPGEGTRNLIAAARAAGARRIVCQSVAFAYAPGARPEVMDEDAPLNLKAPPPFGEGVRVIDAMERASSHTEGLEGVVLRYGWFYGPGTLLREGGDIEREVRRRRFPVIGKGTGLFSFVHVDDAAGATVVAVERGDPGIYNVVDDEPAAMRDWLPAYARAVGAPRPLRVPVWIARLAAGAHGLSGQRAAGRLQRQGQERARLAAALAAAGARASRPPPPLAELADRDDEEGGPGEGERHAGRHQRPQLDRVAHDAQRQPGADQHERRRQQRPQVVGSLVS